MAQEQTSIDPASMNFSTLREEGIKHLEKLAGEVWTDYNTHDPGITILEHLCYAIADLNYRTSFPVSDILADKDGPEKNSFTARQILPCNPVTIDDFRKLIIDCEGIKNAIITPVSRPEPHIYIDRKNGRLHHLPPDLSEEARQDVVSLKGLYQVLLELEYNKTLGDLNANKVAVQFNDEQIEVEFPYWDNTEVNWEDNEDILKNLKSLTVTHPGYTRVYKNHETLPQNIKDNLLDKTDEGTSLLEKHVRRVKKAHQIREEVTSRLHQYRNLGEDFISFQAVKIEEVALVADIEIEGEANMEEILLEIYFQVNQFLSPPVTFHSANQLWEKGMPVEDIFEGVSLKNGFLLTEDLPRHRELVHLSDVVNIMMDIPGIKAIKSFNAAVLPQGVLMRGAQRWCIKLNPEKNYVPRISPYRSDITFYKDGFAIQPDVASAAQQFDRKNAAHKKWNENAAPDLDFPIPEGTFRNLSSYLSIQNDFTQNYGIGPEGLPATATKLRKYQVKQLKAYLLFFDQILANHQAQLANIKQLFIAGENTDRTYFYQPLSTVPDIEDIYDQEAAAQTMQAMESETTFFQRRNRFLNHLLARMGLNVPDYTTLTSGLDNEKQANQKINDKINLIKQYPELSAGRMRGFNYRIEKETWDTTNVSGLKKRICRLLGIHDTSRRSLASLADEQANEGFHLVEHITLRPKVSADREGNPLHHNYLKAYTNHRCQDGPWEEDPYSSIISLVLPKWIGRFTKTKFRIYLEKITHLESPAHIAVNFHWISPEKMAAFEEAYRSWLAYNADPHADPARLTRALNALTTRLNTFQQQEEFDTPGIPIPEIPEPINEQWEVHDFGTATSRWIYGEGNTLHQVNYTGNCKRTSTGEGTIALHREILTGDSEAIEGTLTMDPDQYSEAGIAFLWRSPDDYWLLYYRAFHKTVVVARVIEGVVQKVLENPVKDIKGKEITLRVNTYKGQIKCLQSSPNTIGSEFIINTPGNLSATQYGLYTRYSNNTRFTALETITSEAVNTILPLPGLGNMFIAPTDRGPTFIVK